MAASYILGGAAVLLLLGICIELRIPLLSLFVRFFVPFRSRRGCSCTPQRWFWSLVPRYETYWLIQAPLKSGPSTPAVSQAPADASLAKPEEYEQSGHTPSMDDQSDTATVHGNDDPTADPQNTMPVDDSSLRKDEELWFEDGNLILTTPTVRFRVYRGLLVAHSPVFRDMLSLPQPPEATPPSKCANCMPIVTLPLFDSPSDLHHFLKTLTARGLLYVTPTLQQRMRMLTVTVL